MISVQAYPGKKTRPYLPNNQREKRAGGLGQAVEHLPSKLKDLSSNPRIATKKKNPKSNISKSRLGIGTYACL
jgi:hypothetical protein